MKQTRCMSDEEARPDQGSDGPLIRTFGWLDMFVPPEEDPRSQAPSVGERQTLVAYLHAYRQTLELKCAGLDASALARRSVPHRTSRCSAWSATSRDAERHWFRRVLAGEDAPWIFRTALDRNAQFNGAVPDPEVVAEAWAAWRQEVEFAEQFVEAAPDLAATGSLGPGDDEGEIPFARSSCT